MNKTVMNMRWFALFSLFMLFMLPTAAVRAQDAVDCESRDYHHTRCDVDWRDARLVRQLSDTQCVRGQNWGIDRRGLWVDRGCAGRFVEARRGGRDRDRDRDRDEGDYGGGRGWHPGPDWDRRFAISCASEGYRYTFCSVDLGGGGRASLAQQDSNSPCVEGRTWGYNRAGIWVDQGCSATFTIERRWR
jgi:hypothetical protein